MQFLLRLVQSDLNDSDRHKKGEAEKGSRNTKSQITKYGKTSGQLARFATIGNEVELWIESIYYQKLHEIWADATIVILAFVISPRRY